MNLIELALVGETIKSVEEGNDGKQTLRISFQSGQAITVRPFHDEEEVTQKEIEEFGEAGNNLTKEEKEIKKQGFDQLQKALNGKVVVDREKLGKVLKFLQWLGSTSDTDPPTQLIECVEIFESFLPKEPNPCTD